MSDKPVSIVALDTFWLNLVFLPILCLAMHQVWEGLCDDISVPLAV